MENQKEIFCLNHRTKYAKKHCELCNSDLCNECALDLHIDHYQSLKKIENSSKKKELNLSEIICDEIKKIVNNSLEDISLKVYNHIKEKKLQNLKEYKINHPNIKDVPKKENKNNNKKDVKKKMLRKKRN